MNADAPSRYLADLTEEQQKTLQRVNRRGLSDLRTYLDAGNAVAFLGAGASAPLYRLWAALISEFVECASDLLTEEQAATCRIMAKSQPDAAAEVLRQQIGPTEYREALWKLFRVRRDPDTGRTWTPTHEFVVRCNFAGVVTTNYDPGIANARMAVRPTAEATGYSSWTDEHVMDRWRTLDVFGDAELPVLFAHGHHNQPENMVLAAAEYRRAYENKLARVLGSLFDTAHLVWIGFSFADQRIAAILRQVSEWSGTRVDPGQIPRHIAVMPWEPPSTDVDGPDENDPQFMRSLAQIQYGARLVLYPAPGGDHSALDRLLEELTDPRFAAAPALLATSSSLQRTAVFSPEGETPGGGIGVPRVWVPEAVPAKPTGHAEQLTQPNGAAATRMPVDRSTWQDARAAVTRLRDVNRDLPGINEALCSDQQRHLIRMAAEMQARQEAVDRSLAGLTEQTKELEAQAGRRLRAHAALLQDASRKLGEEGRRSLDEQEEQLRSELAQEREERERDFGELRDGLAGIRQDRERVLAVAGDLVADVRVLAEAIADNLPHKRFAPGRLAAVDRRLALVEGNLADGIGETALAQAQDLWLQLGDLRAEVEFRDQEWQLAQIGAVSATTVLLEQIRINSSLDVSDEQGKRIEGVTLDVDFWSEGELTELRDAVSALGGRLAAETHPPTLEELRTIINQDAPAFGERLTEIVSRAGARQFASQIRVNLAELVVETLEDATGYVWEEGQATYAGEDPRRAFYSKVRHLDDSEIVVEVAPDQDGECCELRILSYDAGIPDEEERASRAHVIAERLRDLGLRVGSPSAESDPPDPALADFDSLRQKVPEPRGAARQAQSRPGAGTEPGRG
jgi:hypothetical protein